MKPTIAIMALLLASPAWADGFSVSSSGQTTWACLTPDNHIKDGPCDLVPSNWHLITKSQSGTVSLIKGLSEMECEAARAKVVQHQCPSTLVCSTDPSNIVLAECFQ